MNHAISISDPKRWLQFLKEIQWDYKKLIKRKVRHELILATKIFLIV